MDRVTLAIGFALVAVARAAPALADSPALPPLIRGTTPPAPVLAGVGVTVVALPGAADAAWPLARAVYAEASIRPMALDEPQARVLCGESAPGTAPPNLRDLAETVAALRGYDAPSRALLGDLARRFSVRAVVVVRLDAGRPSARAFLPDSDAFDAATYTPDDDPPTSWSGAARSLVRVFGAGAAQAPALATHQGPDTVPLRRREFYESGWFWGAIGAAALAGGAVFLATRDSSASAIHLHVEVPH